MRLVREFRWVEKAIGRVKTDKLSVITQRATRNPEPKGLGMVLRAKLLSVLFAPSYGPAISGESPQMAESDSFPGLK